MTSPLSTMTGVLTISISSTTPGVYSGCTMQLQDHAGNLSSPVMLDTFVMSNDLEGMCDHPALTVPKSECLALVALYSTTNGSGWTNKQGWFMTADVEQWFGVRTALYSGARHVDGVFLQKSTGIDEHGNATTRNGNNLVGILPINLGDLPYVKDLNISKNSISGTLPVSWT